MRLVIAGCEYSGTTTLTFAIDDWMHETIGVRFPLIHDHWKLPHTSGHPQPDMTEDERQQVLALSSELKEMTQRHSLYYHIQSNSWNGPDWMSIGLHIEDGVYGPMYYGYGGEDEPHDRKVVGQQVESSILRFAPDVVLVHVKASADVIVQRMRDDPHAHSPLKEADIPTVLDMYEQACARSLFRHKITLDTSDSTVAESVAEFAKKVEPFLTEEDRSRILTHRIW
ncbi:MAG: hypothetical protein OXC95_14870 [Dehalococcoidia bacterium]|nr:hypothetical protein [Dehalococcoidia bacterium]